MARLLIASRQPLSGKTAIAAGIAENLRRQGKKVALERKDGDPGAPADRDVLSRLSSPQDDPEVTIVELPAGEISSGDGGRIIVVARSSEEPEDAAAFCREAGNGLAGVVLNMVPARRAERARQQFEGLGLKLLALVPEDRILAAPVLAQIASALEAETDHMNGQALHPVDNPVIASIAVDPGQAYFNRTGATTVIVRSDKPDLQLSALNAGAGCLIVTGGLPILSYVTDRAEDDEIPLIRTELGTLQVVERIESLYAAAPFAGGRDKLRRAAELLESAGFDALLAG